jgi:uncharacterized membrane protein
MNIRKSEIIITDIVLLAFIVSFYFYPQMPERMATHWNARGQADDYMAKHWGLFFMPIALAVIALLFVFIPRIDPLKANIEKFRKYYDGFVVLLCIFFLCVQYFIILWNLGIQISPNVFFPIGLGLLYFYIGIMCEYAKRNWFVGIRTPWTLSSDIVWKKTHKIGGKLFKIASIIIFAGAFWPKYAMFFVLIPAVSVAVFAILYSYFEYQKVK